jgi:hypothetical protein
MRVNQKKLAAYRKSHGKEIFCTKEKTYDIVMAQFLVEQSYEDSETVNVETLAEACGFDFRPVKEEDGYLFFQCPDSTSKVVIDHEHSLKELDLCKPLIFADGKLIDGHHRLYRAFMLGIETLQAYTLTPAEAKLC